MPFFAYKARDKFGVSASGEIEAASEADAVRKLTASGFFPISLELKAEENPFNQFELWLQRLERVKIQELIVFMRQLSSIIKAGIPLMESLDVIIAQIKSKKLRRVVLEMRKKIESGSAFSAALAEYPEVFSALMVNMVKSGEGAGILDEVLERIAEVLEKEEALVRKTKAALRYPSFVFFFLGSAFVVVVTFIVPRFTAVFQSSGVVLPLPTRILLGINYFVSHYWFLVLLAAGLLFYAFRKAMESKESRLQWDRFVFSLPVLGNLLDKMALSRFARTLAAMLKSGIPIVQALEISSQVTDNLVIAQVVDTVRQEIIRGGSFAEQLRGSRLFPPLVVQMVAVGEKSGNLEEMLVKVSEYFDRETDYTIGNLTSIIEPLLISALALLVMLLALGVLLPMWSLYRTVQ